MSAFVWYHDVVPFIHTQDLEQDMGEMKRMEIDLEVFREVFDPEFTWEEQVMMDSTGELVDVVVTIEKMGGGTIGKKYAGLWHYMLSVGGTPISWGRDLESGLPHSHRYMARLVALLYAEGNLNALEA